MTDIIQYDPYITINKVPILPVKTSMNFTYFGKDLSISMNCDHVKEQLIKMLLLHPLQKIEICQLYVFSTIIKILITVVIKTLN